jgi:tryptophan synthase beta subunit
MSWPRTRIPPAVSASPFPKRWKKPPPVPIPTTPLGSVLNHVCHHQTIIGLEAKKQFEKVGDYPDMIFAACGGGSNFAGAAFPFLADKAAGDKRAQNIRLVAVEPTSCPTLTKGITPTTTATPPAIHR